MALSQPTDSCALNGLGFHVYSSSNHSGVYQLKVSQAVTVTVVVTVLSAKTLKIARNRSYAYIVSELIYITAQIYMKQKLVSFS